MNPWENKRSVEAIRARFERDVERFCQLENGQRSTMDAPVAMALITEAAVQSTQPIRRVLDVGCGAGNNTIALLRRLDAGTAVDCDLLDLASAMLARAKARVAGETRGQVRGNLQFIFSLTGRGGLRYYVRRYDTWHLQHGKWSMALARISPDVVALKDTV